MDANEAYAFVTVDYEWWNKYLRVYLNVQRWVDSMSLLSLLPLCSNYFVSLNGLQCFFAFYLTSLCCLLAVNLLSLFRHFAIFLLCFDSLLSVSFFDSLLSFSVYLLYFCRGFPLFTKYPAPPLPPFSKHFCMFAILFSRFHLFCARVLSKIHHWSNVDEPFPELK